MNVDPLRRNLLKMLVAFPVCMATGGLARADGTPTGAATETKPNFLILVFDALSARHMQLFGYQRETAPNLSRFAERATVYHRHYSSGNFTSPGVASMLTGTYPWSHRALHIHAEIAKPYIRRNLFSVLAKEGYHAIGYSHNLLVASLLYQLRSDMTELKKTRDLCLVDDQLADILFYGDYNTAFWGEWAALRENENPPSTLILSLIDRMRRYMHRNRIQADYQTQFPRGVPHLHSLFYVLEDAIDWLQAEVALWPRPFVSYVHVLPPHEPYTTRREFIDIFRDGWSPEPKPEDKFSERYDQTTLNQQRRQYDEYIAYADAEFGRLMQSLESQGVLDNTYVIVTSDHGELFERGIRGHVTSTLWEPVIHVPLLIASPRQRERHDVWTPTSCVDLLPTLLQLAGRPSPDWCEGRVLPPFGEAQDDRSLFSVEAKSNPKHAPLHRATVTMIKGQYKLVRYIGYPEYEASLQLRDLSADPEEMTNLYQDRTTLAQELTQELNDRLAVAEEVQLSHQESNR
jgi:choline-sulfatase